MNKTGVITIIVILALILIGAIAFRSNDTDMTETNDVNVNTTMDEGMNMDNQQATSSMSGDNTSMGATTSINAQVNTGTTKSFTVTGNNFAFSPSTMTVNKGDKVRVTFINQQGTHDWKIDEFKAATKVISGIGQETIEFTADKSGSFEYYCSVGTHRQMGMRGTLTVK